MIDYRGKIGWIKLVLFPCKEIRTDLTQPMVNLGH